MNLWCWLFGHKPKITPSTMVSDAGRIRRGYYLRCMRKGCTMRRTYEYEEQEPPTQITWYNTERRRDQ